MRSGGRFGVLPEFGTSGSVYLVVRGARSTSAWPEKVTRDTYHVRLGAFPPHTAGKLLCRIEAPDLIEWLGEPLDARVQLLADIAREAATNWGDDLSAVTPDTPVDEIDSGAARCHDLAVEVLLHEFAGEHLRAVAQAGNCAFIERLVLGQPLGYDRLWQEVIHGA
jgi:hypothetical protein